MNIKSPKSAKVRNAVKAALGTGIAVPLLFAAAPASAASPAVQNLRAQIQQLEQRLDMLENQQAAGDTVGIGETDVDISGYVKLDAIYDMENDQGATLLPADVSLTPSGDEDAHLGFTAKQTRLSIATTTPTAIGDVGGFIQMDMYGGGGATDTSTANGGTPRIRLAYITYGNWLFGRAWTTFANFNYGTFLNFAGPTGQTFSRQEQIRYTFDLGGDGTFEIALEDDTGNWGVKGATETNESVPAVAMRLKTSVGSNLSYMTSVYLHQLAAENSSGAEDTAFGWGVSTGGALSFASGTTLKLQGSYGQGLGDIIYVGGFKGSAAYFDGDSLETNSEWGAIGTITQRWTDQLTSNLVYGYSHWDADASDLAWNASSLMVNLLYSPVDALVFGVEYARVMLEKEQVGGGNIDGDANRLQFSTIYNF